MNITAGGPVVPRPLQTTAPKRLWRLDLPSIAGVYRSSFRYTPATFLLFLLRLAFRSRPRKSVHSHYSGPSMVGNRGRLRQRIKSVGRHRSRVSLGHIAEIDGPVWQPDCPILLSPLVVGLQTAAPLGPRPASIRGRLRQKDKHGSDPPIVPLFALRSRGSLPCHQSPAGRLLRALPGAAG